MSFKEQKQFYIAFMIIAAACVLFFVIQPYVPDKLFVEHLPVNNITVDSLMIKAIEESKTPEDNDTIKVNIEERKQDEPEGKKKSALKNVQNKTPLTSNKTEFISISDFNFNYQHLPDSTGIIPIPASIPLMNYSGKENLQGFFEKLYQLEKTKKGKVRIAYYGDSMIDGDLIVQDFRSMLQSYFGGLGVGYVPIISESAASRYSVKHKATGNWKQENYMSGSASSAAYGINGGVYYAADSTAAVAYQASGIKNAYQLNEPRLFYGKGNDRAQIAITKDKDSLPTSIALNGTKSWNTIDITSQSLKKIKLEFKKAQDVPIYGMDFSSGRGITVDGFSNRGNSGLPISLLEISQMQKMNSTLNYDLIILQFGANVLTRSSKNYNWYQQRMTRVVAHLNNAFPDADVLIFGTADKGTKIESTIITDSSVVKLLSAQQKYAAASGSGFISLFHLMGGINSMPIWTDQKLANTDYTHFSPQGSRKIGRMLYETLMDDYSAFAKARTTTPGPEIATETPPNKKNDSIIKQPNHD